MPGALANPALARIGQLASHRHVHAAFQWFHLQELRIMQWQRDAVAIPAPPFGEKRRAEWLRSRFVDLGLDGVTIDPEGNALGVLPGRSRLRCVLLSAHLDTVFPADTPIEPALRGNRLEAPGACDNGAGIAGMLAIASALVHTGIPPACDVLFCGNVGEEGEGDLRGIRYLYGASPWRERIAANLVLDGAGLELAVTGALGSRRFLATVCGPGGHSWTDAGTPNPIVALSAAIAALAARPLPPGTALNVGTIEGGSSVNAIPEFAIARFDLRSLAREALTQWEAELHRALTEAVAAANAAVSGDAAARRTLRLEMTRIGDRPAGGLPPDAPILETLRAVDRHLGLATRTRTASTDANLPLSLGIPALSLGAGGDGGGTHTRAEWYDATGRELALRRILLLLLALCAQTAEEIAPAETL